MRGIWLWEMHLSTRSINVLWFHSLHDWRLHFGQDQVYSTTQAQVNSLLRTLLMWKLCTETKSRVEDEDNQHTMNIVVSKSIAFGNVRGLHSCSARSVNWNTQAQCVFLWPCNKLCLCELHQALKEFFLWFRKSFSLL